MRTDPITRDAIVPTLLAVGLGHRGPGLFTLELAPGYLGWLGLNRAWEHDGGGELRLRPVVGVRHQETERIAADCCGLKMHGFLPATICRPLGRVWDFSEEHATDVARDMAAAIASEGLAFMHAHTTLAKLLEGIERGLGPLDEALAVRRPIVLSLMHAPERARDVLDQELARLSGRTDRAAEFYRYFAAAFRKRLPPG